MDKLSEPFQFYSIFISLMLVIEEYLDHDSINIPIENPILFDASCSGIQHLSALTRELEIAKKVNIISDSNINPYDELPQDFYSYACDLIQSKLNNIDEFKNINLNIIYLIYLYMINKY